MESLLYLSIYNSEYLLKKLINFYRKDKNEERIINLLLLKKRRNDFDYNNNNSRINRIKLSIESIESINLYCIICQKSLLRLKTYLGIFGQIM